ncbi:MAG: class I adenylate-forming enzyme family protein [Solimonas sp.]
MPVRTLGQIIERNERLFPQRPALVDPRRRLTHRELAVRARKLAAAFAAQGLRRQDRFAVLAMNCGEYIEAYAAAEWAGYVIATVNFRLAEAEIDHVLGDAAPALLLFEAQYMEQVGRLRERLDGVHTYVCIGGRCEWAQEYEDFLAGGDEAGPAFRACPDDALCLVYTSGTTGKPKGVLHTQASGVRIAEVLSSELQLDGDSRLLAIAPLFHTGARTLSQAAYFRGGCLVLHRGFDAQAVNRCFETERITAVHLVPTMVQALLDAPNFGAHDFSSLKMLMYAAAPMPLPLLRRAVEAFGPITWNGYGQTEINGLTFLRPQQHVLDGNALQVGRLASVGQPHWQAELKIVDDDGSSLPAGAVGEVCARSATAMSAYWNNSAATAETLRDGWVLTGDMGYLDDEGYLFLVDRRKDMIISGGENIYSREVELALAEHPEVLEAAVVGRPDPHWGEAVHAAVVRKPGAEAAADTLIAFCKARIASYKCPKSVAFVTELPRMASGKVNKVELRQQFIAKN